MATFNTSHHESGGVVLFSGELILLFCDNVYLSLPETGQNETGRLYLTTHRMIFTNKSMRDSLKSFSAPFYSMHDLNLEQPIFGANYIKGKVKDANTNRPLIFKLKFNSGGAIEYGQALQNAARMTRNMASQTAFQPPPPYTPSASAYYQAPPNIYQPAYNVGFVLPTDVFNQPPPAGFVYTSEAPPPYPGLGKGQPNTTNGGYPSAGNGYPSAGGGYPSAGGGYPSVGGSAPYAPQPTPGFAPPTAYPQPQPGFATGFSNPAAGPYPYSTGGPTNPGYGSNQQPPAYSAANGAYPSLGPNQPPLYPSAGGAPVFPSAGPNQPPAYPNFAGSAPAYPASAASHPPTYPTLNNDAFAQASAPPDPLPEKRPF